MDGMVKTGLSFFSGKKVFIPGHTGFKGSWMSRILMDLGAKLNGYALSPDTKPNIFTISKITAAYGIKYLQCGKNSLLSKTVKKTLKSLGPVICEIVLDPKQPFSPRSSSKKLPDGRIVSRPLEDMTPFLSEEELQSNMLIGSVK